MVFLKRNKENNYLTNLIYFNICVFIIIGIFNVFFYLLQLDFELIDYLGVSSNTNIVIKKPWTIISYMFIHIGIFHLLVNLLVLHFSGKIFLEYLSKHQLLSTYLMGGMIGAITYILTFNLFPVFEEIRISSIAIGASASIFAILFAITTYVPNFSINLFFINGIKLKHIAIITLIIDILSIPKGNPGGHIAHIGGALYGSFYIYMYKRNMNSGYLMESLISWVLKKNVIQYKKNESDYEYNTRKKKEQEEIDGILDKINRSGYDSLSEKEKQILFKQK